MKQYTPKEFIRIVIANGYIYNRTNGDHAIFVNSYGRHISITLGKLTNVIARRLIKEYSLELNIKKAKRNV